MRCGYLYTWHHSKGAILFCSSDWIFDGRQDRRTGGVALVEEAKTIRESLGFSFCKELVFLFEDYFTESPAVDFSIVCDASIDQHILYAVGTREEKHAL